MSRTCGPVRLSEVKYRMSPKQRLAARYTMTITSIDADHRVQLPAEWAEALGLRDHVTLERTADGILVRPSPRFTWDDIFANKLVIGSAPPDENDDVELTGD